MQDTTQTVPAQPKVDPIAAPVAASTGGNTSGQGSGAIVPDGVKGWGWGPFFLTWIWGVGNGVWLALLTLVPYVGIVMIIILGIKGREWAWQNKHWDSVEHFNSVQRKWSIAGLVIGLIIPTIIAILIVIFVVAINPAAVQQQSY